MSSSVPAAPVKEDKEKAELNEKLKEISDALAASEARDRARAEEEARRIDAARAEFRARQQEELEYVREYLASNFFAGDKEATDEYLKVREDVLWGAANLSNDGDPGNDLETKEEFDHYMTERLVYWFGKKPLLKEWTEKHGREPRKFVQELLRTQPRQPDSGEPRQGFDFEKYASGGSGFWLSADGWILTNEHVVSDAKVMDLRLRDGTIIEAKVVKTDEANDLALLKAEHAPPDWLAVSKGGTELELGRTVLTVGYPDPMVQGVEPKFTDGRISAASGAGDRQDSYQTTVPVQRGNSGGALVDFATGWVVGVVNAKLMGSDGIAADNVSYAIKCRVASAFIESVPEASAAVAKAPPKPLAKGDERAVIDRATGASVLLLRPR